MPNPATLRRMRPGSTDFAPVAQAFHSVVFVEPDHG